MEAGAPEQSDWPWHEMLEAFHALGGAAKNISSGEGGRGCLFATDPAEPVLVRVPDNLLIGANKIEFPNGNIRIAAAASVPEAERCFFEKYQSAFSWGAGGKSRSAAFIAALDTLPEDIRNLLIEKFGLAYLLAGDFARRVQIHFLRSIELGWQKGQAIAPLLDLAGYDPEGLRPERGKHLQIQGYARKEVRVSRGAQDAWSVFCLYGFASRETNAFSLSVRMGFENRQLAIGRKVFEQESRGRVRIPRVRVQDKQLNLSYLPIGNRKSPRLPRGIVRALLHDAGLGNSDETFDEILRLNALRFIKLLRALEPHEGELVSILRTTARYQLEAMAHCIGSREIAPAADKVGQR